MLLKIKNLKPTIYHLLIIGFGITPSLSNAQSGTTAGGITVSNSNYQIGLSIGEILISSYSDDSKKITNGIIQPLSTDITSTKDIEVEKINVFPNPTTSNINLEYNNIDFETFELFTLDNRILHSGIIDNKTIDLSTLPSGMYVLRLKSEDKIYSSLIKKTNL